MNNQDLQKTLKKFDQELPHFPDGRIDYSEAETALVLGIVVVSESIVLLVKRSQEVSFYPGKWNWVSGFIDEAKPLGEFVEQELAEETGITAESIDDMYFAETIKQPDEDIGKTWLICPVVVTLTDQIEPLLDWEASEYAWVQPEQLARYDTVPGVAGNIIAALERAKQEADTD